MLAVHRSLPHDCKGLTDTTISRHHWAPRCFDTSHAPAARSRTPQEYGMPSTMWIRTVDRDDIEAIRDLLVETWHATYDGIYGKERVAAINRDWHSAQALRKRMSKPYSEFVIADDGEDILGVAFASMGEERIASLHQLYVNPNAQSRGTGTALLIEMESAFPMAAKMRLEVEEANEKAIAFYQKQGYRQVDRTENCGTRDSGIPALIFEKTIG